MKITKELARATKYYILILEAAEEKRGFKEAHKNYVAKMREYQQTEKITDQEAQYNIETAANFLLQHQRAE